MSSPVVIDDGGSTRIKQLKDGAKMDDLVGKVVGGVMVFQDTAADPFVDGTGAFQCALRIRYHEEDGSHHIVPVGGQALAAGDTIVVRSRNGQVATLTFNGTFKMFVSLTASAAGVSPIVEAKQDGLRRRYVVSNAGPIQTIALNGAVLFDSTVTPSIYTMLHFK